MSLPTDIQSGSKTHIEDHKKIHRAYNAGRWIYPGEDLQTACQNGALLYLANGVHNIQSLNLTDKTGISIIGQSLAGTIINVQGSNIGIDMSGGEWITIKNLTIRGGEKVPRVGIFLARTQPYSRTSSGCVIEGVRIDGKFSLGGICYWSAELNYIDRVHIVIDATANPKFGIYSSARNTWNIQSDFIQLLDVFSNSTNRIANVFCGTVAPEYVPIWLGDYANGFYIDFGFLYTGGDCYIKLVGAHYMTRIQNFTCEYAPKNGIRIEAGGVPNTQVDNIYIHSMGFPGVTGESIYIDPLVKLTNYEFGLIRR